jgi:hypothetical protein
MHQGKILFSQIIDYLPRRPLDNAIKKYHGEYKVQKFSCRDQLLAMIFAQLTDRSGLRSIEETLAANQPNLYHLGFRCDHVARSTLAAANEDRPWEIWAEFAQALMKKAAALYRHETSTFEIDARVFALDSTTIELCLSRFPWTPDQADKAAVKMHTLLDLRGQIPSFIVVSPGKTADVSVLDDVPLIAGAYYVMDRGYLDFARLFRLQNNGAFFVTRAKRGLNFAVATSRPVDKTTGVLCDQIIYWRAVKSRKNYSTRLRRIKYRDPQTQKVLVFLTNDFDLPALTVAKLYQQRWQVELFFKWIKQNLRIKKFYGYSENAVKTQLWIAIATYCLLAIIRYEVAGDRELHEIQEILSASIFTKIPIFTVFSRFDRKNLTPCSYKPLLLFE